MRLQSRHGFWQLTWLPHVFPVNVYLVADGDGLTLVDTGLSRLAGAILEAARSLGRPIRRIALTHAHADHAGGLDRLKAALPDVTVVCSAREAAVLDGDLTARADEPRPGVRLPGRFVPVRTTPDVLAGDGDTVGPLVAVATPGHTPGHVSYLHEPSATLFAGDAFQTRGGLAVAGDSRPLFPFVARATWDRALAVASARRATALPVRHLAPGHGEILDDPLPPMAEAIARARAAAQH
jgi:glyoxylase-like metal-dependent hydrolase (beta-lactamase superfamily II)